MVLAVAFMGSTIYSARVSSSQVDKTQAYYMAIAGINKAEYYLANTAPDASTDGSYRIGTAATSASCPSGSPTCCPDGLNETSIGGTSGSYTICIETVTPPTLGQPTIKITSTGTFNEISKTVQTIVRYRSTLEAWYKGDEGSGSILLDSGSKGIYMIFPAATKPKWTDSGKVNGGSVLYAGGAQSSNTNMLASLATTLGGGIYPTASVFSISAWVYPTATTTAKQCVLCDIWGSKGFYLTVAGGSFYVNFTDAAGTSSSAASGAMSTGAWAHISASYDGTTLILYKNGTSVTTATTNGFTFLNGSGTDVAGNHLYAYLDEVRFYSRALSSTEIGLLYTAGTVEATNATAVTAYGYIVPIPGSFTEL